MAHLLHQFLVDALATGGVHDEHIMPLCLGLLYRSLRYGHGIGCTWLHVHGHLHLFTQHPKLLHGRRPESVASSQQGVHVTFFTKHLGQLTTHGSLAGTVETHHQDHSRMTLEFHLLVLAPHQGSQLVVHNLHHELLGLYGGEHVLAQGLLLHGVGEVLGHLVVHIGVEQCASHILERFRHIDFRNLAFALQYLEGAFKSFT